MRQSRVQIEQKNYVKRLTRYDDIQEQKAIEVIRYLKSSGTSIELIMGATGLTKEEIEKL